jgi:hypothetical protein
VHNAGIVDINIGPAAKALEPLAGNFSHIFSHCVIGLVRPPVLTDHSLYAAESFGWQEGLDKNSGRRALYSNYFISGNRVDDKYIGN